jgi:hypothetical protein
VRLLLVGLLFGVALAAQAELFECGRLTKATGTVIQGRTQIHTGSNSRVELQFSDRTVARIGSYAAFECTPGARQMALDSGTLLLSTPKGGKRVTVQAGPVIVIGSDFEVANVENKAKVIGLNGKTTVALAANPKEDVALRPGEVVEVPPKATKTPKVKAVNLKTLISTSVLMKMGPLPAQGAIEKNAQKQVPRHTFRIGALSPDGAEPTLGLAAEAMQATAILAQEQAQQVGAQQLAAQQAAEQAATQQQIAAARQFAIQQQQVAEQQRVAQQQAQQQGQVPQGNQGQGPQGNQGQGPQGNQGQGPQGNQGNKPPAPPGQAKK